ncbi:MAG: FAD-binding oxidoreductase [Alphaproteobacteria bacterium]|nr:FAD-binding oxidoreductase [Alphaproteobacteria bacterium]
MLPQLITDPSVLGGLLTDASNLPGRADGLVRPRSAEDVADILRHCQSAGIPVLPTAGRTSTTGGATPDGGWLMSMAAFDAVGEIGHDRASAGAGVWLGAFQSAIEATGRFYPPDPTSRNECTLGASVACNASGARSFRYGATRRWVEGLRVVLPTGEILDVRRGDPIPADWPVPRWHEPAVKTAAGYAPPASLLDLFVGTEGTLGVITDVTVRLTDLPSDVIGLIAFFPDRASALAFVEQARDASRGDPRGALSPRCLEYFDRGCLGMAEGRTTVPDGAGAALFCEQEVEACGADAHLEAWLEALTAHGALVDDTILATDGPSRSRLLELRHAIPAGINERVVRNGMRKIGTDLAVPDAALPRMMDLYEASPVEHVLFGHIGDSHLHLNLLPSTPEEAQRAKDWYDQLAREAIALGGTVSAEHGIGKLKRDHLRWMVGEEVLASFRSLKRRLDPNGILGRGNVFEQGPL